MINHRATSIAFLRSTGLIPVKIPAGEKAAFKEWDPRKATQEDHSYTLVRLEQDDSNLNMAALFHGKFADVDVDSTDPIIGPALDYFLPATPYTWGRASKPRSHRAYALLEDFDRPIFARSLKLCKELRFDDQPLSVEIRGGKPENGLYSVLPGSIHPSGERYEWSTDLDASVSGSYVSLRTVVDGVRLAQAMAIIVPCFTEGLRNDLSLALAGLLWRIRATSLAAYQLDGEDDHDGSSFLLTADLARRAFEAVLTLAGDDPQDRHSRLLNFKNTWTKLDRDPTAKITGGKILAEALGDQGTLKVRTIYRLLSDSDDLEAINQLAEQFVIWYGQGVCVDMDLVEKGFAQPWMSKEQTINSLGGRKILIGDKKIPLHAIIFQSTIIRRIAGLTFDPSSSDLMVDTYQGTMINQWRGFGTEPCPQMILDEEVTPFCEYITDIIAAGDEARAEWVYSWLADMLQRPAEKPGTALVLTGVQGAGKTYLGEGIIGPIIGEGHYVQVNTIDSLVSKFNAIADNKIFVQCDEATHSYQKEVAARLKSIITDKQVTIEPKGINSYKKPNHMHFLFTSNDKQAAVFIDPSPYERRYTVLEVSAKHANDPMYWNSLRAWMELNRGKVLRWLLDYKYDRGLVLRPLMTNAKRDMQRVSVEPEVAWIVTRIKQGFVLDRKNHTTWFQAFHNEHIEEKEKRENTMRRDFWPNRVTAQAIEEDFRHFVRGLGRTVWSGNVITSLCRTLPEGALQDAERVMVRMFTQNGQVQERVRLLTFPAPNEIMKHLRAIYGDVIDHNFAIDEPDNYDETVEQEEADF